MIENTPYTEENDNIDTEETTGGNADETVSDNTPAEEDSGINAGESDNTPTTYTDEYGEWLVDKNGVRMLVNPSEKWIAENPPPEPEPAPEPEPDNDTVTWDALAKAYAEGVNSLDK